MRAPSPRKPGLLSAFALPAMLACAVLPASAGTFHLFGENDLLVEDYRITGDRTQSPFPFDGTFFTDRLNLNLEWGGDGRSSFVRTTLLGADNDYLAEDGAVLELLSLGFETGTVALPFRLEAGDLFADFSRRTLQRGLRGLSVELQPQWGPGAHSLLLLAGSGEETWKASVDNGLSELAFGGASYLYSSPSERVMVTANLVRSDFGPRAAVLAPPTGDARQTVGSLTGEAMLGGNVLLSGELAYLALEREGREEEVDDTSVVAQLSRTGRLGWKLRYEDNGRDFVPIGGVGVIADRRVGEADARLLLGGRGQATAHFEWIRDQMDGPRPEVETGLARVGYMGQPWKRRPALTLTLSAQGNALESEDRSVDQRFYDYVLGLADQLGRGWEWDYRGTYRRLDDRRPAAPDRRTRDHSLLLGRTVGGGSAEKPRAFRFRLGAVYRDQDEGDDLESIRPQLDLGLTSGGHRLDLHLAFLDQDFVASTLDDFQYTMQGLVYSFERGSQTFSLEGGRELRRPDQAEETDSRRVALRYRWRFDREWGS